MDVAISGSSGFIGSALCGALEEAGHRPIRLVRRPPRPGADEILFEPAKGTMDAAALNGVDAVVNLAGAGIGDARWTDSYRELLVSSRVDSTKLLAETMAGLNSPPSTFLTGSAIGYYGSQGDTELTEQSPAADDFLADLCVQWEDAAAPASEAGIRTVALRTGVVLGKGGGMLGKTLPLFKLGLGGPFGSGRQYLSWITLEDQVGAMLYLLDGGGSEISGAANLTAPLPVTNAEFTKALARGVKRPAIFPVPPFGPKLLLGSDRAQALLFDSIRAVPDVLSSAGYAFLASSVDEGIAKVLQS